MLESERVPLRKVWRGGRTTVPPPARAQASMVRWIAAVSLATPLPRAPKASGFQRPNSPRPVSEDAGGELRERVQRRAGEQRGRGCETRQQVAAVERSAVVVLEHGRDCTCRGAEHRTIVCMATKRRKGPPSNETGQEALYLKSLSDRQVNVSIKLRDGEIVNGWIEYFDDMMVRLTREGRPNLFIYKSQIRTITESTASARRGAREAAAQER